MVWATYTELTVSLSVASRNNFNQRGREACVSGFTDHAFQCLTLAHGARKIEIMRLERTFHPVGHGAFYTERFYDEHNQNVANIVFDCGRYETAKESWCYQSYKTWIEDYVKNHSGLVKDDVIDILFISHFHTDHIIGIDSLLKYCDVKKIVIPAIDTLTVFDALVYAGLAGGDVDAVYAFFESCISGDYRDKIITVDIQDEHKREDVSESELPEEKISEVKTPITFAMTLMVGALGGTRWKYIPYYRVDASKKSLLEHELLTSFPQDFTSGSIDVSGLLNTIKTKGVKAFKSIYEKVFGQKKHNSYSLTLFSGLSCDKRCFDDCHLKSSCLFCEPDNVTNSQYCSVNCLYMGDYEALGTGLCDVKSFYRKRWHDVGLLQVPHHGSEHNSDEKLYEDRERLCVISCDSHDKYNHPDPSVLSAIKGKSSIPLIVTEQTMTKQEFTINLPQ